MIDSFLANRCHYQHIIHEHERELSFDSAVVTKVVDYSLCKNAMDLVEQLRPIASALDRCQSDGSSLADACDLCLSLLSEPVLCPHEKTVSKRFKDAITPEHLTAYMLHPQYRGEKLTDEQRQDVSILLNPSFIATFISFHSRQRLLLSPAPTSQKKQPASPQTPGGKELWPVVLTLPLLIWHDSCHHQHPQHQSRGCSVHSV